jgi:serine/threonine-protein kinase
MLTDLRAMQDALRFGKSLSWPIRPEVAAVPTATRQVAPKMSAVRVDSRRPEREREWEKDPGDVPAWLRNILITVVLVVAGLVVAFLWSNFSKPKLVAVPNVKNMSINEAKATLSQSHLTLRILARVSNEHVPSDNIVDASPSPGTKVRENSDVSVRVSSGSRFVEVPDLSGHTVDEARSILGQIDLVLDDRITDVPASGIDRGKIVGESPTKGTKVDRNSRVVVQVSNGQEPEKRAPDATDQGIKYVYSLKVHLTDITQTTQVRIDIKDDNGTRTIFDDQKNPGDEIDVTTEGHGKEATFNLYYEGKLIKSVVKQGAEAA